MCCSKLSNHLSKGNPHQKSNILYILVTLARIVKKPSAPRLKFAAIDKAFFT